MMEKLNQIIQKFIDCFAVSLYWIVASLPIFTIGASTTALYYAVQKSIKNDRGYAAKEFWGAFKSNFKVSTLSWLVMLAGAIVFIVDGSICYDLWAGGDAIGWLWIFFGVLGVLDLAYALVTLPYIARFEDKVRRTLKNGLLIMLRHLMKSLLLVLIFAAFAVAVYFFPIAILFAPTVYMILASNILEKIFRRYMSEEDKATEDERNRTYQ